MRPQPLIELHDEYSHRALKDTYERVRRTLDDALAELQLPGKGGEAQPHNPPVSVR